MALDVGERRIGVALASSVARLPAPLLTLDRQAVGDVFGRIRELAQKENVSTIVVGLPRNLQSAETEQTARSRQFAAQLQKSMSIPVVMQDEAGTSVEAEAVLKRRGKPYTQGDIDAEAACLILRDFLQTEQERVA